MLWHIALLVCSYFYETKILIFSVYNAAERQTNGMHTHVRLRHQMCPTEKTAREKTLLIKATLIYEHVIRFLITAIH